MQLHLHVHLHGKRPSDQGWQRLAVLVAIGTLILAALPWLGLTPSQPQPMRVQVTLGQPGAAPAPSARHINPHRPIGHADGRVEGRTFCSHPVGGRKSLALSDSCRRWLEIDVRPGTDRLGWCLRDGYAGYVATTAPNEQPGMMSVAIPRLAVTGYEMFKIVPVMESGEPDGGPSGSPGNYRVVFVLGVPGVGSVSSILNLATLERSGDSQIISPGLKVDLKAPQEQSSWLFIANEEGRLGRVEVTLYAADFDIAIANAHDQVLAMLSRLTFEANTGVEVTAVIATEKATGTVAVAATMLGMERPLKDLGGQMTPELLPLLSAYREGLSSTTPLYQALSFYKVCEGVSTFHKKTTRAAAREGTVEPADPLGAIFPSPDDETPDIDALDPGAHPEFVGRTLREVWEAHRETIRNAIAHITPGKDLVVADKLDHLEDCRRAIPPLRYAARKALEAEIARADAQGEAP
jgi:hypothetical protein